MSVQDIYQPVVVGINRGVVAVLLQDRNKRNAYFGDGVFAELFDRAVLDVKKDGVLKLFPF